MPEYTESLDRLIDALQELPGIGKRTAERLAFHVLNQDEDEVQSLADALTAVSREPLSCSRCYNVTEQDPCEICSDPSRDRRRICVCETPRDLMSLENSGEYNGLYHVLLGTMDPLEGIDKEDLTLEPLLRRIREGDVEEVIIATNPTAEGDGTALYVSEMLEDVDVTVTRIARGIPSGSSLEYASPSSVAEAVAGRRSFSPGSSPDDGSTAEEESS